MILTLLVVAILLALSIYAFNKLAACCKKQVSGFKPIAARCAVCHIGIAKKVNSSGNYICENC